MRARTGRLGAAAALLVLLIWGARAAQADHGTVLESDDFDNPAAGIMPRSSGDPRLRQGYVAGEYQIAVDDRAYDRLATVAKLNAPADVAIAISVRFEGEGKDRYAALGCRAGQAGHYRMSLDPTDGAFRLARWLGAQETQLAGGSSSAIRRGLESNRIELSCTGSTIEAIINGVTVARVTDRRLTAGGVFFGAGKYAGTSLTIDARFDRYVLTQPAAAPQPTPGRTATPGPTPAPPVPPPPGSQRVSGALVIEGQPAPAGTTVRARVGDQECGAARLSQAGRYSIAVLPESAAAGCGRPGVEVRLMVTPAFGSGWRERTGFPFQPDGVVARDITVDLRQLPGQVENVPWTAAWWGDPTGMSIGMCAAISETSARAVMAGYQQWVDAYYDLGFVLAIGYDEDDACSSNLPGIMIFEEDLDDDGTIAGSINLISPDEPCRRTVPCWSAKAMIVINPDAFAEIEPQEQANIIAHEIGHALGLGHAHACNGGTIMWADTACRYPMTHIGVDDVASLNAKFAVVGFGVTTAPPGGAGGQTAAALPDAWLTGSLPSTSRGVQPVAVRRLLPAITEWHRR